MKPIQKIELPAWMCCERAQRLLRILGGDQFPPESMFVGGCVRNTLLQADVTDIDIATKFLPDEVTEKLKAAGIKVIPTGIKHGTVTAVIEGKPFEITTLRRDVATDGRHAEVAFTQDWIEDAERRDFTMNTLLADLSGNIYDPTGLGLQDLKARRIVFVGNPARRIEEDYLRILRFFRFFAVYGAGEIDRPALAACKEAANEISTLSRERITQEFLKILSVSNADEILQIMFDNNVLKEIFDKNYNPETLRKLSALQLEYDAVDVLPRLFVLAGNKPCFFEDYLRFSHAQKKFIIKMEMAVCSAFYKNEKALKKAIFYHGNKLLLQGYIVLLAKEKAIADAGMIELLKTWQAPKCPITGETLILEGYKTGPELGQELKCRQEEWLEENVEKTLAVNLA